MDFFRILFPVSGVETSVFVPPLIAFVISFFSSMAGITGAFLILPFQMSALGFTTPSVSATNFLYNVVGTPGGIVRYMREGRMVWPLALAITIGTLPGVLAGYYIRVRYLPDPRAFKLFVGVILLYIGMRVVKKIILAGKAQDIVHPSAKKNWVALQPLKNTILVTEVKDSTLIPDIKEQRTTDQICSTQGGLA